MKKVFSTFIIFSMVLLSYSPVFDVSVHADALSDARDDEEALQRQLEQLEREIAEQEQKLQEQKGKSATITGEINILKGEINATKLNIQRKNAIIGQLSGQIAEKEQTIQSLDRELLRERDSLAQLLRKMNELDDVSIVELVLSQESLSDYFIDRDNFNSLQLALQDSSQKIRTVQEATDEQRKLLETQKVQEADIKAELEQDKQQVERKESEQQQLLSVSKATEQTYEYVIRERQAQAAQIRARLFELAGGVQGGGIAFGDAVTYATAAEATTGVRAALILAVLSQESDLGKNVGTCNRPGDARTWRDIMPGPGQSWRDDQAAFLQITRELGINPDGQPLSCPLASGGWGGAMGPSQFIPSTWLSVRSEVARLTGASLANPWNPRHAVMATAVYMRDLGAAGGGYTAERNAACRYYSGRACGQSSLPNTFYGNSVVAKANNFQNDINFLAEN
jgi:membrane-bound lytic murein transglycosylase B